MNWKVALLICAVIALVVFGWCEHGKRTDIEARADSLIADSAKFVNKVLGQRDSIKVASKHTADSLVKEIKLEKKQHAATWASLKTAKDSLEKVIGDDSPTVPRSLYEEYRKSTRNIILAAEAHDSMQDRAYKILDSVRVADLAERDTTERILRERVTVLTKTLHELRDEKDRGLACVVGAGGLVPSGFGVGVVCGPTLAKVARLAGKVF